MNKAVVFIDSGFLSKLSRYFGKGKYLSYDIMKFCDNMSKKENLECEKIHYYTAPPFQSNNPSKEEKERKDKYDTFIKKISKSNKIIIREGRCQRLIDKSGNIKFSQKAVDSLMVMDMMSIPIKNKDIKKIILIACDSDFVPVIKQIEDFGIITVLYTYFTKKRDTNFSRSTDLMKVVSKYVKLTKQDFENASSNNKEEKSKNDP